MSRVVNSIIPTRLTETLENKSSKLFCVFPLIAVNGKRDLNIPYTNKFKIYTKQEDAIIYIYIY